MRRDQPKTPEPMRSALFNIDQPRIPHSEYHYKALLYPYRATGFSLSLQLFRRLESLARVTLHLTDKNNLRRDLLGAA